MFRSVYSVYIVLFYALFVCKCVLHYCHRVATKLLLTKISFQTIYHNPNKLTNVITQVTNISK
jgi:hypothetical protein